MRVNLECRHFPGDRPCFHHKQTGENCTGCSEFAPKDFRILIIKLEALGDVLRTTCLLPSLKRDYPDCHITWLTIEPAQAVLFNNPFIDEILVADWEGITRLDIEKFDLLIHPDAAKKSAALASLVNADRKLGYRLDPDGQVRPFNREAEEWLEMGARDDIKRANRRTYQEHVHAICGLDPAGQEIVLRLTEEERSFARAASERFGIAPGETVVGFNTGSSARWPMKRWLTERFLETAGRLADETGCRVLLLGGALERETNGWIAKKSGGRAIDTGSGRTIREYMALLSLCDVVLTGDTMGLHASLALDRRVVALFGPTSPWEIDLYGGGEKIITELDCVCCYRGVCDRSPNCMQSIGVESVIAAVKEQLGRTARVGEPALSAV